MTEIINDNEDLKENTFTGVTTGVFENDADIKERLHAGTVADVFMNLKKEVDAYYGEGN